MVFISLTVSHAHPRSIVIFETHFSHLNVTPAISICSVMTHDSCWRYSTWLMCVCSKWHAQNMGHRHGNAREILAPQRPVRCFDGCEVIPKNICHPSDRKPIEKRFLYVMNPLLLILLLRHNGAMLAFMLQSNRVKSTRGSSAMEKTESLAWIEEGSPTLSTTQNTHNALLLSWIRCFSLDGWTPNLTSLSDDARFTARLCSSSPLFAKEAAERMLDHCETVFTHQASSEYWQGTRYLNHEGQGDTIKVSTM